MSLTSLTAVELGKKIKAGEVSVEEAVQDALGQIRKKEPELNSFVTVDEEGAMKQAHEIQKRLMQGNWLARLPESRRQSRIICVPKGCLQRAAPKYCQILYRHTQRRRYVI